MIEQGRPSGKSPSLHPSYRCEAKAERPQIDFLHRRHLFLALSVLLFLAIWVTTASAAGLDYKLGAGDRVKVTVFGHEDLSGEFEVDGSGQLSLPLIQDVDANGIELDELEERIIDKLRPDYLLNPQVSVEVLNYRPFYILGEVRVPGSYAYVNGMTVVNAVAMAGGFTYRAKETEVVIIRANDPSKSKARASQETTVLPGDVIEIPERFF